MAIFLAPTRVAMDSLALGASRLGGVPDLPVGVEWPHHAFTVAEVEGWPDHAQEEVREAKANGWLYPRGEDLLVTPLAFVGQLDLAQLRDPRLPPSGTLLFFVQAMTQIRHPRAHQIAVTSCVLFSDGELVRTPVPLGVRAQQLEMNAAPHALKIVESAAERPRHSAFPEREEGAAGPSPPEGCAGLLTVDSDPDLGSHFGDASWLTFSIPDEALAARNFQEAFAEIWGG